MQTLLPGDEIAEKVLSKVLAVGFGGVARPTALHLAKRMKSRLLSWKAGGAVDGPSVRSVCTQGDHVFTGQVVSPVAATYIFVVHIVGLSDVCSFFASATRMDQSVDGQ